MPDKSTKTSFSYFNGTMYEAIEAASRKYGDQIALDFMGSSTTYRQMHNKIILCARALKSIGVMPGDTVTIALPNCPQAIYMFYAINLVGGIANMVHPLSAEKEIEFYLNESGSAYAITLELFYEKFAKILHNTKLKHLIITRIEDALDPVKRASFYLLHRDKCFFRRAQVILWKDLLKTGRAFTGTTATARRPDDISVILYSGGTTGKTKGVLLTNQNFNALAQQILTFNPTFCPGDKMLAAMPVFHGFGLGVCIHTMLFNGGRCILLPRFSPDDYAKLIIKYQCNFIAGVPTLFEALLRQDCLKHANLQCLKGVFSGGDSLAPQLKEKINLYLSDRHASVCIREGYGTTETVAACCLTPPDKYKEGSVGLPFPDTCIKIVHPGTEQEVPYGTDGEILIAGPAVMKGYLHHPEETAKVLRQHTDGRTWLYTGDLGFIDEDGFLYFKGRAKRVIITSGYNVYPTQLENILDAHKLVQMSCVIGLTDPYKVQKVKAFIKLAPDIPPDDHTKNILLQYCREHIAKYAIPYDIEFRKDLPKTPIGKVAYRVLEEESRRMS